MSGAAPIDQCSRPVASGRWQFCRRQKYSNCCIGAKELPSPVPIGKAARIRSTVAEPTFIFSRSLQSHLFLTWATPAHQQGTASTRDLPCLRQEELARGGCAVTDDGPHLLNVFRSFGSLGTKWILLTWLESSLGDVSQGNLIMVICQNDMSNRSTRGCRSCRAGWATSLHI